MPALSFLRSAPKFAALLLVALAAACAPKDSAPPAQHASLTGGWWHLVEIKTGKETMRPSDPMRYTLTLHGDGAAEMQLDCNKGRGKYSIKEKSATEGELNIGPLAVTKMFCGPNSLGDRVGRDMSAKSAYKIDGNRLTVAVDGGTYIWEQASLD